MLNVLRESFKKGPYLKVVLVAVGLGLVAYLGSYFTDGGAGGGGGAGEWAARVDGVEVSSRRFVDTARNLDQYYRRLFGDGYDQVRGNLRIGQQAVQQLIEQELILQDAQRLGLHSSKTEIAGQIRSIPGFQDENGRFVGVERYRELVDRSYTGGVAAFEGGVAQDLLLAKWTSLVTQPVVVDDAELEDIFRERTEKTRVNYVVVAAAAQEIDEAISAADEQSWYDAHRDDYRRAESRRIRFVVIERDAQLENVEVSAADVQTYYDENQTSYTHEQQRRARHILLRAMPEATDDDKQALFELAQQLRDQLVAGDDFEQMARERSDDTASGAQGGDLGFFDRGAMLPEFENAAFETPVGELAPIVETSFGFHIIQVTDAREAGVTPLEQVEETIRRTLEVRRAQELTEAEAARLSQTIGNGDRLDEVAAGEGLSVETRVVVRGERLSDIGASPDFVAAVSTLAPGELSAPLQVAAGLALVTLDEVLPPAIAPLADVRASVKADILSERTKRAALDAATRALARGSVADAAASLGLEVQDSGEVGPKQPIPETGGLSDELREGLFGAAAEVGKTGVVPVPAGALIYEIAERVEYDAARFASEKNTLRLEVLGQRRSTYRQHIVNQLRQQHKIELNQPLLARFANI